MGFLHPHGEGIVEQFGLELDGRGNIAATDFAASVDGIFAAGDARRGQSLIVWAIAEGRQAARACDAWLAAGEPDTSGDRPPQPRNAARQLSAAAPARGKRNHKIRSELNKLL